MKTNWVSTMRLICAAAIIFSFTNAGALAAEGDLKLEAQLVQGSNDAKPKDSNLKPVAHDIEKKLKHLPLKWDHYYVVGGKKFTLAADASRKITLSTECQISVRNLGGSRVEVTLMNQSQTVGRITQSLHKGQTLVAGGDADNSIVVLWQTD
jgi:hypothetical protein